MLPSRLKAHEYFALNGSNKQIMRPAALVAIFDSLIYFIDNESRNMTIETETMVGARRFEVLGISSQPGIKIQSQAYIFYNLHIPQCVRRYTGR